MQKTVIICILLLVTSLFSQSVKELDKQADKHFENKEYTHAIDLWLQILEIDPDNEDVQKKIEIIYEIKQRKDIALQKSKIYYKIAKKVIKDDFKKGKSRANSAINNFIIAYRIDPRDPELSELRNNIRRLEEIVKAEEEKDRLSQEIREKAAKIKIIAFKNMELEQYEPALRNWNRVLELVPSDREAKEGRRKAKLAIDDRLKFERIKTYLSDGKLLFAGKKYSTSRIKFVQVIKLDKESEEAKDFIEKIDDKLEEVRRYKQIVIQAEEFYKSGVNNLNRDRYPQALEDFESILAILDNYKDVKERIKSIDGLKEKYYKRLRLKKLQRINVEFQNGLVAFSERNYVRAISSFGIVIKNDPENKRAKEYLLLSKNSQKQIEEEIVDIDSPYYNIVNTLSILGKRLYKKGEYDKSKKKWNTILNLFPKNREAIVYTYKCDFKKNREDGEKFALRNYEIGKKLLKEKKYSEAESKFKLISLIFGNYKSVNRLLKKSEKAGRRGSSAYISRADKGKINRQYRNAINYYQRGGKKNSLKALALLKSIVKIDPNHLKSLLSINKIEAQMRIGKGSVRRTGRKLSVKQQRLVKKYYYAGINYYTNNKFRQAIRSWRRVLAIDPGNIKAKNNIRKVLVYQRR